MRSRAFALLAAAIVLAPLGGKAADLVVWWEKGFYEQEDEAVREIVAAFEEETGNEVESVFYPLPELPVKIATALEAGRPPDFAFGTGLVNFAPRWAFDDRLVDLSDTLGSFSDLFDPDALARVQLFNGSTEKTALYALPVGRANNHLHVWTSLLNRGGFTLAEVPREWEAFWSFWCDEVQPAVREATGRGDVWAVGLPMSRDAGDTWAQVLQFIAAYRADYVTRDGWLVIDDPSIRRRLVKAIDSYTKVYSTGCTRPGSVTWSEVDNNRQFLAQAVVMTPNQTLSIPNAIKRERPAEYLESVATIEWPLGADGRPFPIRDLIFPAMVFKAGGNTLTARAFVRFLIADGWLAHYLNFSGERLMPTMPALLQQPFWLDTSDPHRVVSMMQLESRPLAHDYATASGNWRHRLVEEERVWPTAVHRVVTDGISPEQAVDEAIARIKEILSE